MKSFSRAIFAERERAYSSRFGSTLRTKESRRQRRGRASSAVCEMQGQKPSRSVASNTKHER